MTEVTDNSFVDVSKSLLEIPHKYLNVSKTIEKIKLFFRTFLDCNQCNNSSKVVLKKKDEIHFR